MDFLIWLYGFMVIMTIPIWQVGEGFATAGGIYLCPVWYPYVFATIIFLIFYFLKAEGLYKMAQTKGLKKAEAFLAFIPFANTLLMGKLADNDGVKINRQNPKQLAKILFFIDIVLSIIYATLLIVVSYIVQVGAFSVSNLSNIATSFIFPLKITNIALEYTVSILYFFFLPLYIAYNIVHLLLLYYLSAKWFYFYRPISTNIMLILSFFLPPLMSIFIFLNRKALQLSPQEYFTYRDRSMTSYGQDIYKNSIDKQNEFYKNLEPPSDPFENYSTNIKDKYDPFENYSTDVQDKNDDIQDK